jgi:bifunctional UDP-N-acetylglucosamine pyrophosphorylase/glucosamine-1-phosphate N-acetyltransferase
MALSVVILAAGQGKRMRSDLPKVLQPLAGRPLLAHVLDTAAALNPAAIHVVYGHGGEAVREALPDAPCRWVLQAEQLGTGHAVAQALPAIADSDQVLVLCGDVPLVKASTLERLRNAGTGHAPILNVLTVELPDPHGYGRILRDADGTIRRVVEERDAGPAEREIREINTGLMLADARSLRDWLGRIDNANAQHEYYLTDITALAVADGVTVHGVAADDPLEVLGINDKAQLATAERSAQRRYAEQLMREGASLADPDRIDIRGRLRVGRDVFIDVGAVFQGDVTLGDRVRIGPYSLIADASIGHDSCVHAFTVIERSALGAGCEIGPYARLRPGNEFADQVKVGNFVEVKNSRVAPGSKMNHLSYVGDSDVGRGVNIGAGTITCNYDGANKHRTVIRDGAFIGSGVMLVAPVEVGAGATIGAGSTISKQAPAGQLTVARARQISLENWQRPVKHAAKPAPVQDADDAETPAATRAETD